MPTGLAAELAMRGYERERIIVEDVETEPFEGFNRNPFMFGFAAGELTIYLVKGLRALNADERKPVFRELLHGGDGVTPAPEPSPVKAEPKGELIGTR